MSAALPRQSRWLFRWFRWYARRYLAKHFHAVRLSRASAAVPADGRPLVFVMNHPAWWDILVAFALLPRFPLYRHFAPIEASMLDKYRMFRRLGFFGIEPNVRGANKFVRTTQAIFEQDGTALWITAQGRFVDPRERPIHLHRGVGYLAAELTRGTVIPVAVEYPFWSERCPEALVRIGNPLELGAARNDRQAWCESIASALTATQDALAQEAIRRDPAAFEVLVAGRAGIGGVYDLWRRAVAWSRGRAFDAAHAPEGAK